MRLRAILLAVLALYVLHVACEHRRAKRQIAEILEKAGKKVLKKILLNSAKMVMKKGAMSFLEQAEINVLQEMIQHMEYEKMQKEMRNKLIKASLMMNATYDIYTRNYDCDLGPNYIELTFKFGVPNIPEPDKWILKFFNEA